MVSQKYLKTFITQIIYVAREINQMAILEILRAARRAQKEQASATTELSSQTPQRAEAGTIIQLAKRTDTELSVNEPRPIWAMANAESVGELRERLPLETPLSTTALRGTTPKSRAC